MSDKNRQELIAILKEKYPIEDDALTLFAEEFDPFFIGAQIDNLEVFACEFYILNSRVNSHWKEEIVNKF